MCDHLWPELAGDEAERPGSRDMAGSSLVMPGNYAIDPAHREPCRKRQARCPTGSPSSLAASAAW
jgi:hypothetical protein